MNLHTLKEATYMSNLVVEAFIEIPKGSQNKYEYDKERGVFLLDRVL